jgi:hypothetical protein
MAYDVAPVVDPAGEGSGGGLQNAFAPEPALDASAGVLDDAAVPMRADAEADEFDVDRVPLDQVNLFEQHPADLTEAAFDEGALYATAAADAVAVALGQSYGFDARLKGHLDAQAIGDGLAGLGTALGASQEQATVAAREVMATAAAATTYPPTPRPVLGDGAEDAMEAALGRLQGLSEGSVE